MQSSSAHLRHCLAGLLLLALTWAAGIGTVARHVPSESVGAGHGVVMHAAASSGAGAVLRAGDRLRLTTATRSVKGASSESGGARGGSPPPEWAAWLASLAMILPLPQPTRGFVRTVPAPRKSQGRRRGLHPPARAPNLD